MANGRIKGITITLEADSQPLERALKDIGKASRSTQNELNQINRALKFDPENTTLLKQKFDVLQDAIKNTETKLNALKQAQAEVDRQFQTGEIDAKTYREFQREIEITEGKLKAFKQQAEDTKVKIEAQADMSKLEKVKSDLKELGSEAKKVGKEIGEAIAKGATAATAALGGLAVAGQETASDIARMNAVLSNLGFDNTTGAFDEALAKAVAITGEMDSAVEAINNLANTSMDQSQLLASLEHLTGAAIQFSDTLKLEGLADGLQETLATGQAIGQFGEYLERMGMNLDDFNAGLAEAQKNGTEINYVLETLSNVGAKDFLDSYKDINGALYENQKAQAELEIQTGKFSETLAPLMTTVKEVAASILEWMNNNPVLAQTLTVVAAVITTVAGIIAALGPVISGIISLIGPLSGLFAGLAGPIGIAIAAITALIAIGVALYKNWDEVSAFLTQCWDGIQNVASTVWTAIKDFFTSIWEQIKEIFETVVTAIFEHLKSYWQNMSKGITTVWDGIQQYFSGLWELIKNIFVGALLVILQLLTGQWSEAKKSTEQIWQNIKNAISNMWEGIKKVFSGSLDTIKKFVNTAWNNIKSTISSVISTIVSTVTNKFIEIVNSVRSKMNEVLNTIKSVWGNVKTFFAGINLYDIGKNIIQGLINGIKNMTSKAIEAVTGVVNGVINKAKSLLKIKSPSRVFMEIGEFTNEGFIEGIKQTSRRLQDTVNDTYGSLASSAAKSVKQHTYMTNITNINNSATTQPQIIYIQPAPVILGEQQIAEIIFNPINQQMASKANIAALVKGVQL